LKKEGLAHLEDAEKGIALANMKGGALQKTIRREKKTGPNPGRKLCGILPQPG